MANEKASFADTQANSIRHKDQRANMPTEGLRDFVADDESAPKTMLDLMTRDSCPDALRGVSNRQGGRHQPQSYKHIIECCAIPTRLLCRDRADAFP
jgi:hypothetical protein